MSETHRVLMALPELPVELECGHRILLPWGADPAVGAAVVARHPNECGDARRSTTEHWATSVPWEIRRLGPPR